MMNNGLERAQVEVDGAVDLGVVVVVDGGEAGRLWRYGLGVGAVSQGTLGLSAAWR